MSNFSINHCELLGNLSRDPELKKTSTGKFVLTLNMVTNYSIKNQDGTWRDEPTFHRVIFWGKLGEWLSQNLQKGFKVYVSGRIHTNEYTDKQGVVQRQREIIAESVIPCTSAGAKKVAPKAEPTKPEEFPDNEETKARKAAEAAAAAGEGEPKPGENAETVNPEDIPF